MLDLSEIAPEQPRELRREEYDKLVDLGCFEDEDVELLYGVVVPMSPHGAPHDGAIQVLTTSLIEQLRGRAAVRSQSALVLGGSEPEPDVALVPPADYRDAHPTRAWLVVEVAQSSLKKDLGVKARLYAENDVPEYWVVNLVDGVVEVHTDPKDGAYRAVVRRRRGDVVRVERFPDVTIQVTALVR